ncbi:uncharacterized protein LOC143041766 [Oratosquilla oratoria]|uniref:uncharacterized protein LOC143041766 n=1 Tax=Oratosquilla oratoria TaxID=337810 RepID=UPI003F773469
MGDTSRANQAYKHGIHTNDGEVKVVRDFPTPRSAEHVRFFLGRAGYYRAFLKNFVSIASPLTRLLMKDTSFQWCDIHQKSFDILKLALTEAPVLVFPDYSFSFIICTDASGDIRDVLMQQVDGFYTDHTAVPQLYKGKNLSGRLTRWFLTIEEFNPTLKHI